ncbi:hypothetical protein PGTUg99_018294 [Puccinia graminis f. sp. tritici]|uniref:Uncharacterized protein n=1 Tax=Puccinia graminis f. sp. tritici TaxID=56615 RepID=A0A5B0RTT9_PUCGR|nr:hypothetical protein PGTUg99_018294 [Puccinia graminis f. sp. tritici]
MERRLREDANRLPARTVKRRVGIARIQQLCKPEYKFINEFQCVRATTKLYYRPGNAQAKCHFGMGTQDRA